MEALKFETTVLENGIIKIPEISKLKNKTIEIFIIIKDENNTSKISFEQWNEQFTDNKNLDEYITEYGMTLKEYRKKIYEAEMSDDMSLDEFKNRLKQW